jgi:serine/threonine-protein kinase ATR
LFFQVVEDEVGKDEDYVAIQSFVKAIKQNNLALASFECRAYARSLMHLESHLRDKPREFKICMTKLQQVYGALDESDYVFGLAAVRHQDPNLEELIHHHQVTGNFQVLLKISFEKDIK